MFGEVIVICSEKIKDKIRKGVSVKFFFVNLQAGILQFHYELTFSLIIFRLLLLLFLVQIASKVAVK